MFVSNITGARVGLFPKRKKLELHDPLPIPFLPFYPPLVPLPSVASPRRIDTKQFFWRIPGQKVRFRRQQHSTFFEDFVRLKIGFVDMVINGLH